MFGAFCEWGACHAGAVCFFKTITVSFLYREDVVWAGGEAFREYFYSWEEGGLKLYFPEKDQPGALFLDLKETHGVYMGAHPCKADTYDARFHFNFPDCIDIQFTVTGPHKDMVIRSVLQRFI